MNRTLAISEDLERIFKKKGFNDYKFIDPEEIVVSHWVRMKCTYGCSEYGRASCPPNNPEVPECEAFLREYKTAAIFHFEKHFDNPDDRTAWVKEINLSLLELEREVFLSGQVKAFVLFIGNCEICEECSNSRESCKHPKKSRPSPEGLAIDVFTTVKKVGYPIKVLKDHSEKMNRYAFLLIE